MSVIRIHMGSPMTSDCAYFLGFMPCRNVIYTGSIGALQENIRVGDIIVPTGAVRGEGASKYHAEEWYPAVASFHLLRKAAPILEATFSSLDTEVHYGIVYTTDSFAAETKVFLEKLRDMHILGIEMETSAVFTVAQLRGANALAIHVVSDNPIVGKSLVEPIPQEDRRRRESSARALQDAILRIAAEI